jgi:hypothetical protein
MQHPTQSLLSASYFRVEGCVSFWPPMITWHPHLRNTTRHPCSNDFCWLFPARKSYPAIRNISWSGDAAMYQGNAKAWSRTCRVSSIWAASAHYVARWARLEHAVIPHPVVTGTATFLPVITLWYINSPQTRNGSGQARSTVKIPVRKEASTSIRLLILYGVPVVNV